MVKGFPLSLPKSEAGQGVSALTKTTHAPQTLERRPGPGGERNQTAVGRFRLTATTSDWCMRGNGTLQ